ncbi:MAG: TolC family protein [Cyclobacteriaceae bacterium]|nr:TolC family protein [Cyclobacteriaceae bacterium]
MKKEMHNSAHLKITRYPQIFKKSLQHALIIPANAEVVNLVKITGLAIALVLVVLFNAPAQTLNDYLQLAAENNPLLKARYHAYLAALEKIPQARALPDPQLSVNMFVSPDGLYMDRFMGRQLSEISVMQMFPWAGIRRAAQDEATSMARMKWEAYVEAQNNLFHEVRTLWYQLYENDKQLQLLAEEQNLLKTLEQIALVRYTTGQSMVGSPFSSTENKVSSSPAGQPAMSSMTMGSSPVNKPASPASMNNMTGSSTAGNMADVLRIRLQIKELDAQVAKLTHQRVQLSNRFVNLLNTDVNQPIVPIDTLTELSLPAAVEAMRDSLIVRNPMLKMNRWEEQAREAQLRMSDRMARPMMGIGLTYMIFRPRRDEVMNINMGGENMLMPMFTLSVPIYQKKYKALKSEAALMKTSAQFNSAAAKTELENELERLLNEWNDNLSTLQLLGQQIEFSQHILALLTTAYETGNGNMDELLRQRQALLNYRKEQVSTLVAQHILLSAIKNITGTTSF